MIEFPFEPAPWLPSKDVKMLERVRNIKRDEMEYTNENGFSVRVVMNPPFQKVQDLILRLYKSDVEDKKFTAIFPNQDPELYTTIAETINRFNINCRNFNAFAMDEWADQDGNVAPLTYGAGLGYSFYYHFFMKIREDLRPPESQWHCWTNDFKETDKYSKLIEEVGEGGADVIYSNTGWPGHTAFIDPGAEEFHADTLEEFLTLGSRISTQTPLTIAENSLFPPMGAAGDVWAVPPRCATIGPRDMANSRERFIKHDITFLGGDSWQRMISRIELYGPISMECPSSIARLGKGICYVSETIARPFGSWTFGQKERDLG